MIVWIPQQMAASVFKLAVSGVSSWWSLLGGFCRVMPFMVMPEAVACWRSRVRVVMRVAGVAGVMPCGARSGLMRVTAALMVVSWAPRTSLSSR